MLPKIFAGLVIMLGLSMIARGDVIYSFTYTAQSGPFASTTFQLDEPNFLVTGTYSIAPFTVSDGSLTYNFTHIAIGLSAANTICVYFGTAAANLGNIAGQCSAGLPVNGAPDAMIQSNYPGSSVPSAPGFFLSTDAVTSAFTTASTNSLELGNESIGLTITQTPEPATAPLVGVFLAVWGGAATLRIGRCKAAVATDL